MSIVYRSTKGSKLTSAEVDGNFQHLENLVGGQGNSIIEQTGFTLLAQDLTINPGWNWRILSILYTNASSVVITIPFASSGNQRIDLIVANQSNSFERIAGTESVSNPTAPAIPSNKIAISFITVTDGVVGAPSDPILGTQFKKKTESLGYGDPSLSGTNAVIQLRPEGNSYYALGNVGLVSIDGFGLDLITGVSTAEAPYSMKDLFIENTGTTPFTLKHDGAGTADVKFFFTDETDLIVPAGGKLWLKYGNPYCQLFFKSWNIAPYKVYTALLTQSGTSRPLATELENTLGEVEYSYDGVSSYSILSNGLFTVGKTVVFFGNIMNNGNGINLISTVQGRDMEPNRIPFYTYLDGVPANSALLTTPIEIRVYN